MSQIIQYLLTVLSLVPFALPDHQPEEQVQKNTEKSSEIVQKNVSPTEAKKIDLNQATFKELTDITGIGPKKAQAIISFRSKQLFHTLEELLKVKGIGRVIFKHIHPLLSIASDIKIQREPINKELIKKMFSKK